MANKPYQKTEKWWLILVVLFYVLYNFPGVPGYGNANTAIWHGILTLIPLWICIYVGLFKVTKQRRLADVDRENVTNCTDKEESGSC
ncbi:MAG: hypothetical protein AAGU27_27425 [Dehalobacterium sp.]